MAGSDSSSSNLARATCAGKTGSGVAEGASSSNLMKRSKSKTWQSLWTEVSFFWKMPGTCNGNTLATGAPNSDLSSRKLDATCELQGRVPCANKCCCCRAYLDGAGHVDTSRHVETICGIGSREPAGCKRKWHRDTMRSFL